jgi:hypothetical protein
MFIEITFYNRDLQGSNLSAIPTTLVLEIGEEYI